MTVELLKTFKAIQKKQKAYQLVLSIASWDSNTEAPKNAIPYRAEMLSVISGESFSLATSKDYQDAVYGLYEDKDNLDLQTRKEVEKAKRSLDKIVKIPKEEYVAYYKLINISEKIWEEAKEKDDYELFKPYLKEIIEAQKKMIAYRGYTKDVYDVLLDDYEEGMSKALYDDFFNTIKTELVPFVKEVLKQKPENKPGFITDDYEEDDQKRFVEYLMDVFNYDLDRGVLKKSVHPFTWNTHSQDVRFTVRYLKDFVFSSIFAGIHELGHALYEQQIDEALDTTNLNTGTSMGMHESQSRFYENMIGRSKAFWETNFDQFKALFPKQLEGVDVDDFYQAINWVEESFIRVEADELTYPLHILIRYEIERMIFEEDLDLETLPTIWNQKMKQYLNIEPQKASDGVLQDVHWSAGMFGYFPTYALGSAYAAQIYYTLIEELDFEGLIKEGNIATINAWLKEKIHHFGSLKKPREILKEITNEDFNPSYYVRYLKEKYQSLFIKE